MEFSPFGKYSIRIEPEYLQNYRNEFRYKFNRSYFDKHLFGKLMVTSVACKNQFRDNYG
jgi:hypothetical protein